MTYKNKDKFEVLREVWGYDSFRPLQSEIIDDVLEGRDVLALLSTSAGKSLLFQIPSLIKEGTSLIISPLLSLQQDQVETLKSLGVRAEMYNSTQGVREKRRVKGLLEEGKVDLLYVAPETILEEDFLEYVKENLNISFIGLDEVHCFPGETRVMTDKGNLSFIELESRINLGEEILVKSMNTSTNTVEFKKLLNVFRNPSQRLLEVKLSDRFNFLTTPNHVIFTDKGEVLAKDLTLDHKIVSLDSTHEIISISYSQEEREHLYDIEVEDNHNYFILSRRGSKFNSGRGVPVLVHNCISQYGSDFRPKYYQVGKLRRELGVPVLGVTATADSMTLEDVKRVLSLGNNEFEYKEYKGDLDRPSIRYNVLAKAKAPLPQLFNILDERDPRDCGIIYCTTRKEVDNVATHLYRKGYKAVAYHAGMANKKREENLDKWLSGEVSIAVCTIAFGMGIDKKNVRYVIHYNLPSTIEGYIQECGRASRDGLPSDAYLMYTPSDANKIKWILENSTKNKKALEHKLKKLAQMNALAKSKTCIRKQLLTYFNQEMKEDKCGNCSNCISSIEI